MSSELMGRHILRARTSNIVVQSTTEAYHGICFCDNLREVATSRCDAADVKPDATLSGFQADIAPHMDLRHPESVPLRKFVLRQLAAHCENNTASAKPSPLAEASRRQR